VQTAWAIPVAQRLSPPKKKIPSPPDQDKFISLEQVPSFVEDAAEEVYTHNSNVLWRRIEKRTRQKISDLSKIGDEEEEEYDSDFIDDSEATSTKLT